MKNFLNLLNVSITLDGTGEVIRIPSKIDEHGHEYHFGKINGNIDDGDRNSPIPIPFHYYRPSHHAVDIMRFGLSYFKDDNNPHDGVSVSYQRLDLIAPYFTMFYYLSNKWITVDQIIEHDVPQSYRPGLEFLSFDIHQGIPELPNVSQQENHLLAQGIWLILTDYLRNIDNLDFIPQKTLNGLETYDYLVPYLDIEQWSFLDGLRKDIIENRNGN